MPRSFLVKKVKLDEFSAGADMESAYRHRADLSLRLHDKGRSPRTRTRHATLTGGSGDTRVGARGRDSLAEVTPANGRFGACGG